MTKPIVVVGSINLDLVVSSPRIPGPGETILGTGLGIFTGGKGANQAAAAARLGYPTRLIARVGNDAFAEKLIADLRESGVDTSSVSHTPAPSGVAVIVSAASGENSIVVAPGANDSLSPCDLEQYASLISGAAAVLAQLEIPLDTVVALARLTSRAGVPLILDPAPAQPLPPELLTHLDWITPNETEARLLAASSVSASSPQELRDLAEHFISMGPRNVVLKFGERGAYLATHDGVREFIPCWPVDVVDTTAAGDAFNGGFAVALADGSSPSEAARFASAVAAVSVTRRGALPSLPTREQVDSFLCSPRNLLQENSL